MSNRTPTNRRPARWMCVLALATLLVAGSAMAGQPRGTAQLEAVDQAASTLTLKGEVYKVTNATRMVDALGRGTQLERLRPLPRGAGIVADEDVDVVSWDAVETRNGWVLTDVRLVKSLPR